MRQVVLFKKTVHAPDSHSARMQRGIDSAEGHMRYGRRFATVEPVFGNLRYNKGLDRFTLRGKTKVDGPWKLFCLVHNIEKLAHHGHAQQRGLERREAPRRIDRRDHCDQRPKQHVAVSLEEHRRRAVLG